jgi:hypothetical protein
MILGPGVFRDMNDEEKPGASAYQHLQKSVQRPDVGVEAQFRHRKAPKTYRYDSSLAPELCWDENAERPFAEWLLNLIVEAALKPAGKKPDGTPLYQVEVKGLDIFRPDTMETDAIEAENLPCWMLDTDYNGMVFCASQVFFPKTSAWDNLQKSLKGEFSDQLWAHLAGTVSEPFALGDKRRIAVKVIDDRGNELMVVKGV